MVVEYWLRDCVKDVTRGRPAEMTRCHDVTDYDDVMMLTSKLNDVLEEYNASSSDVAGGVCLCEPKVHGEDCNNQHADVIMQQAARKCEITTTSTLMSSCNKPHVSVK